MKQWTERELTSIFPFPLVFILLSYFMPPNMLLLPNEQLALSLLALWLLCLTHWRIDLEWFRLFYIVAIRIWAFFCNIFIWIHEWYLHVLSSESLIIWWRFFSLLTKTTALSVFFIASEVNFWCQVFLIANWCWDNRHFFFHDSFFVCLSIHISINFHAIGFVFMFSWTKRKKNDQKYSIVKYFHQKSNLRLEISNASSQYPVQLFGSRFSAFLLLLCFTWIYQLNSVIVANKRLLIDSWKLRNCHDWIW